MRTIFEDTGQCFAQPYDEGIAILKHIEVKTPAYGNNIAWKIIAVVRDTKSTGTCMRANLKENG